MYLAFCSDVSAFNRDQLRDQQWSYRFPGSGWITCLYQMAAHFGIAIASGDVALMNVKSRQWDAGDVYVIQDMESIQATQLLKLGAVPFLITCFEAPLYAPFFYDKIHRLATRFKFSFGYGFTKHSGNLSPFRFPSYYLRDIRAVASWHSRKKLVLVAGNKYKTAKLFIPSRATVKNVLRQLKWQIWRLLSPAYRQSLKASLHDRRLELVTYFANQGKCELYGSGWGKLDEVPSHWANQLNPILDRCYLGLCEDKLTTIAGYQFAICFENMSLPGYVTEKIIDCFVAGTIPLYLGAPDIASIVPAECFIDLRQFHSPEQLDDYLSSLTEEEALNMIEAGRAFLLTEAGQLHSYEGFAQYILALAKSC
ncbi:MAG: glycosyltransferase family 10 [Gallionellaceae bacterium]|jgi:hypothetical protein